MTRRQTPLKPLGSFSPHRRTGREPWPRLDVRRDYRLTAWGDPFTRFKGSRVSLVETRIGRTAMLASIRLSPGGLRAHQPLTWPGSAVWSSISTQFPEQRRTITIPWSIWDSPNIVDFWDMIKKPVF